MTCTSKLRRLPADPHETVNRVCCTFVRRAIIITYEPETELYLTTIDIENSEQIIYYTGTAQEITGRAIWTAVDGFVVALKNAFSLTLGVNNLSTKIDAIYPFIGGDATKHKYNLCNPLDTDAAFRLSFSGGWTHSRTGALPNGSNAYANTHWIPSVNGSNTQQAFGAYFRNDDTSGTQNFGVISTGTNYRTHWLLTAVTQVIIGNASDINGYTASPTTRFMFARRETQTMLEAYRDGTSLGTNTGSGGASTSTHKFYFAARNVDGTSTQRYCLQEHALGIITGAAAITNTQAGAIRTAVDNLQAALFRNV